MPHQHHNQYYLQLIPFQQRHIIGLHKGGVSYHEIAHKLHLNHSTIIRCWNSRVNEQAEARKPGSGVIHKTTPREDFLFKKIILWNHFSSATVIAHEWWSAIGRRISLRTVYNRMIQMGFRSYRPLLRLSLTSKHQHVRLNWYKERQQLDDQWKNIIFSDESCFRLWAHDGRINV